MSRTLPAKPVPSGATPQLRATTPDMPGLAAHQARARARPRVLVVDDNRGAAEALAVLLCLRGFEVHVRHDGMAALTAVHRLDPDLVLLDIGLPGLDGYEVAQRVRHLRPATLLVAVTGFCLTDDLRRSQAAGFVQHLVKPVAPERLEALLAAISLGR